MRKLAVVFAALIFVLTGSMAYAGQFGPPEPAAKEGKVSLGLGYFYYSAKWNPKDYIDNWVTSKVKENQAYLQLGYGVIKNWEVYLRVGGADMKATELFDTSADSPALSGFKSDFKDGYKPFGTIGLKGVFNVSPSFGIGPFFQASLYSNYEDKTSGTESGSAVTQEMKIKRPRDINLGVGLQGKVGDVIIYGGPVVYWTKTTIEQKWREPSGNVNAIYTMSFKEKNNVGGFAGLRVPLSKSLNIEVEGQYKSEFSMGGALTYSF